MEKDILFFDNDPYSPENHIYRVKRILFQGQSKYQEIKVLELDGFGLTLVLDGVVQFSEKEEFVYHEAITHIPMFTHPEPKNILILGGGDLGVAREVLKHNSVKNVKLVDIDQMVTDVSKQFFYHLFRDSFEDKRLEILHMDGIKYVSEHKEMIFDVAIIDLTDPIGPAKALFEKPFYEMVNSVMSDDGIMAAQTESIWYHPNIISDVQKSLRSIFPIVDLAYFVTPTYTGYWWTISIASKKYNPRTSYRTCALKTKYYSDDIREISFVPQSIINKLLEGKLFK